MRLLNTVITTSLLSILLVGCAQTQTLEEPPVTDETETPTEISSSEEPSTDKSDSESDQEENNVAETPVQKPKPDEILLSEAIAQVIQEHGYDDEYTFDYNAEYNAVTLMTEEIYWAEVYTDTILGKVDADMWNHYFYEIDILSQRLTHLTQDLSLSVVFLNPFEPDIDAALYATRNGDSYFNFTDDLTLLEDYVP